MFLVAFKYSFKGAYLVKETISFSAKGCKIDLNPIRISSELSAITIFLFKPY
jgi:hypothetical protein